ncbi:MAG: hypothetical protein ABFD49_05150 [Armatimonadota bacterium]|nr:hypothetical protein [bacterium]
MRSRILLIALIMAVACTCNASELDSSSTEMYRIRIANVIDGLAQLSLDAGATYSAVGRVKVVANARITGFAASSYTPCGTVAATAVHGIRIKTGRAASGFGKAQMPLIFSISPCEFSEIPRGYGGHIPRCSAIQVDIRTGESIFRNFSPFVGSAVYVERNHSLVPMPEDYIPIEGETFVIVVKRPNRMPGEIDFDNHSGGDVTVIYPDGASEKIATVDRPVTGVGRYDATTFTGVGAVNTNHGGVLTISTAPVCPKGTVEGGALETRGGFMVQPYYHAHEQGETKPQVMVIGPKDASKPALEGTPPLFFGHINLAWYPARPNDSYRAQVKIDDGDWEDMPCMVGKIDDAFTPNYLTSYFEKICKPRKIEKGVTAVRLLFPSFDPELARSELDRQSWEYAEKAVKRGVCPVRGTVQIEAKKSAAGSITTFYVDGRPIYTSSACPTIFDWDTTRFSNGFHELKIETMPASGEPIVEVRQMLVRQK